MERYLIEEVKCWVTKGGLACGPVGGAVNAAVKYRCNNESKWISASEFDGIASFFLTDNDIFDYLMREDDDLFATSENSLLSEINGIDLCGEYDAMLDSIYKDIDNPAAELILYICAVLRCDNEDEKYLIKLGKGRYADEIDIPMTDVEEDYLCNKKTITNKNARRFRNQTNTKKNISLKAAKAFMENHSINSESVLRADKSVTTFKFVFSIHDGNNERSIWSICRFEYFGDQILICLWTNAIFNIPKHKISDVKEIINNISDNCGLEPFIYTDNDNDLRIKLHSGLIKEDEVPKMADTVWTSIQTLTGQVYAQLKNISGLKDLTFVM